MSEEKLIQLIIEFLKKNFDKKMGDNFNHDQNLIRTGVLDSYSLVLLVEYLDNELDLVIDYSYIKEENFESINAIVKFLNEKYNLY